MSLQQTIRNAVKGVMDTLEAGSMHVSVTYVQVTPGTYDPVTDARADTETTYTDVTAISGRARQEEVSWTPVTGDIRKFLIAYADLPITPQLTDYILLDGVRFIIKRIRPVPGSPVHILFAEGQG